MSKALAKVAPLVVLCLLSFPLAAQQVTPGTIVLLKSPSGKYLSAAPNETLWLSPNRVQWEQWEVVRKPLPAGLLYLRSYHGTALIVDGRVYHAPLGNMDVNDLGGVEVKQIDGRTRALAERNLIVNGGYMYIGGKPEHYLAESPAGSLVPSQWSWSADEQIPASARWTVEIVSSPLGGRQPAQETVYTSEPYKLKSYHNTFLDAIETHQNVPIPVVGSSTGKTFSLMTNGGGQSDWTPMRFGDSTVFYRQHAMGISHGIYHLQAGANDTLVWGGGPYLAHRWKILPTGSFKIGERVPLGERVLMQWPGGKNIGISPEGKSYIHTNTAQWEWLAFSK